VTRVGHSKVLGLGKRAMLTKKVSILISGCFPMPGQGGNQEKYSPRSQKKKKQNIVSEFQNGGGRGLKDNGPKKSG